MFRFTIRELALMTLVVALAVAWWLDRRALVMMVDRTTRERTALTMELEQERDRWEQAYRILTHSLDAQRPSELDNTGIDQDSLAP
jgi:hypothetical protein